MKNTMSLHPRQILFGAQAEKKALPTCDHYCGQQELMSKSLKLQREMAQDSGLSLFDVTLDCEDGSDQSSLLDQAIMVRDFALKAQADNAVAGLSSRVGIRFHDVNHPQFIQEVQVALKGAAHAFSYVMIPKVESWSDVERAVRVIDAAGNRNPPMPLHLLLESSFAIHNAFSLASHHRVESISFGLMDFVSSHAGAIPSCAMSVLPHKDESDELDQFHHPLVVRAKLELSAACHAYGKVPSHCVVREFKDEALLLTSVRHAAKYFGFNRMWSIHPHQIRPIIDAFTPDFSEVALASEIILLAMEKRWAPLAYGGKLHDRASYRYYWHVLDLAHRTGCQLMPDIRTLVSSYH